MKSIEFLTNHFNSYYPEDAYIYIVFFITLEHNKVSTIDTLSQEIEKIEQELTKNDINLLINFSSDIGSMNFIGRLFLNTARIFTPNIMKNIVLEELYKMKLHLPDDDKEKQFNLLKYYFPYDRTLVYEPYSRLQPDIYYFLRRQLISSCKTKEEIIDKLKYNEEFKFYIIQRFYDEHEEVINKKTFGSIVYSVCRMLLSTLELDDKSMRNDYYEDVDRYRFKLNRDFGFRKKPEIYHEERIKPIVIDEDKNDNEQNDQEENDKEQNDDILIIFGFIGGLFLFLFISSWVWHFIAT